MKCALRKCDWQRLSHGSVDSAVNYFLDVLMAVCQKFIPQSVVELRKSSHPWLDNKCAQAIQAKNDAEGTDSFPAASQTCSTVLNAAYRAHLVNLKQKIAQLSKSDKRWWSLNRELLNKRSRVSSIPPLQNQDGEWIMNSRGKATFFAST